MDAIKMARWFTAVARHFFTEVTARTVRAREAALEEAEAELIGAQAHAALIEKGLALLEETVDEAEAQRAAIHAHGCRYAGVGGPGREETYESLCGKRDAENLPCLRVAGHEPPCQTQGRA